MNLLSLYVKYVAKAAWSERGLQMKRSFAALALALSASLAATAPGWGQSKPPVAGSQSDIMLRAISTVTIESMRLRD